MQLEVSRGRAHINRVTVDPAARHSATFEDVDARLAGVFLHVLILLKKRPPSSFGIASKLFVAPIESKAFENIAVDIRRHAQFRLGARIAKNHTGSSAVR